MVCHQLVKFGGHRYCSSRDVIFLVCHMIKQENIVKGEVKVEAPQKHVTILPKSVVIGTVVVEKFCF